MTRFFERRVSKKNKNDLCFIYLIYYQLVSGFLAIKIAMILQ